MTVQEIIDQMQDYVKEAHQMPLMGGRVLIEPDRLLEMMDDLSNALPQELRQAKAIVADRVKIIDDAKKEAEGIVRVAEERRKAMVNDSEITRQAKANAEQMINDAKLKSKEVRKAANDYVEEIMKRADEMLTANVNDLRKTRQSIKSSQRQGN